MMPSLFVEETYTVTVDEELANGHTLRELFAALDTGAPITTERWRPSEPLTLSDTFRPLLVPRLSAPIGVTEWHPRANYDEITSVRYTIPLASCGALVGSDVELGDANILEFHIGWVNPDAPDSLPDSLPDGPIPPEGDEGYRARFRCGTHSYWGDFVPATVPQDTLDELIALAEPANVSGDSLQWLTYGSWSIGGLGTTATLNGAGYAFTFDDPDGVSPEPSMMPAQVEVLAATLGLTGTDLYPPAGPS